jgi:glycosyltransferase involved in cell wall biosynthesis
VLANSDETAARIEAAGLRPSGPVEVLTPGVSDSWWSEPIATGREPVLLYAGRIMWQKNIELAIDTVRELGGTHRLAVAGMVDVKSQGYLAELRERAAGLPVTFEIAPPDERLRQLYREATALLFTPRNEDFGMVVLEAMAAGTPVLAVDAGGPTGIVEHGVDGWLLPPTAEAFAAQVREADFEAHRSSARATAQRYGWDAHAARVDEVMEQLAEQRGQLGRRVRPAPGGPDRSG